MIISLNLGFASVLVVSKRPVSKTQSCQVAFYTMAQGMAMIVS